MSRAKILRSKKRRRRVLTELAILHVVLVCIAVALSYALNPSFVVSSERVVENLDIVAKGSLEMVYRVFPNPLSERGINVERVYVEMELANGSTITIPLAKSSGRYILESFEGPIPTIVRLCIVIEDSPLCIIWSELSYSNEYHGYVYRYQMAGVPLNGELILIPRYHTIELRVKASEAIDIVVEAHSNQSGVEERHIRYTTPNHVMVSDIVFDREFTWYQIKVYLYRGPIKLRYEEGKGILFMFKDNVWVSAIIATIILLPFYIKTLKRTKT